METLTMRHSNGLPKLLRWLAAFIGTSWLIVGGILSFDIFTNWDESNHFELTQHWSSIGVSFLMIFGGMLWAFLAMKQLRWITYTVLILTSFLCGQVLFGMFLFPFPGYSLFGDAMTALVSMGVLAFPAIVAMVLVGKGRPKESPDFSLNNMAGALGIYVLGIGLSAWILVATLDDRYFCKAKLDSLEKILSSRAVEQTNWDEVAGKAEELLKDYGEKKEIYFFHGLALFQGKHYKEAIGSFKAAIGHPSAFSPELNDGTYDIYYYLATAYIEMGEDDKAFDAIEKSMDNISGCGIIAGKEWVLSRALYCRGSLFARKGVFSKSISDLSKSRDILQKQSDPFVKAVESQLEIVKNARKRSAGLDRKLKDGLRLYKEEKYAKAYNLLLESAKHGNATAQNILGDMYVNGYHVNVDLETARKYYKTAVDKGNSDAMISLGTMFENAIGTVKQDYEKAVDLYRRAANAGNPYGLLNLGRMYEGGLGVRQDGKRAMDLYMDAWKSGLQETGLYIGILYQYGANGVATDLDKAESWYRKGVDMNDLESMNALAYLLALEGSRLNEAEKIISEVLVKEPNDGGYVDTLGWILYKKKEYERAVSVLKKADELCPDDSEILEHLGDAYHRVGDNKLANDCWAKAMKFATKKDRKIRLKMKLAGEQPKQVPPSE